MKIFSLKALVSNVSVSPKILTSKKGIQPSFSLSVEKLMLGCLDDKYSLNLTAWSREGNSTNMSST